MVIARDPRDVVNSFRKITIAPGHDYLIALFNAIDIVDKTGIFKEVSGKCSLPYIRKFKAQYRGGGSKITDFLGLDFEGQMLDPSAYTDHFGKPWDDNKVVHNPTKKTSCGGRAVEK